MESSQFTELAEHLQTAIDEAEAGLGALKSALELAENQNEKDLRMHVDRAESNFESVGHCLEDATSTFDEEDNS